MLKKLHFQRRIEQDWKWALRGDSRQLPMSPWCPDEQRDPGNPHTHCNIFMANSSMNMTENQIDLSLASQTIGPLMNRTAPKNPQLDLFIDMDGGFQNELGNRGSSSSQWV